MNEPLRTNTDKFIATVLTLELGTWHIRSTVLLGNVQIGPRSYTITHVRGSPELELTVREGATVLADRAIASCSAKPLDDKHKKVMAALCDDAVKRSGQPVP